MTGTTVGVAMGMEDAIYLKERDVLKVRIDQLGAVENRMAFEH